MTLCLLAIPQLLAMTLCAAETFKPYQNADDVPQNVKDLWKDYDATQEPLNVEVVKQWNTDGVVTRYVTFKVGTFKGSEARIAAYYSFPDNGRRSPAFVWSHGGGQRAERGRGVYFAQQGFATVDINWLGRPMEDDIDVNTNWGNVDPSQGPQFYSKALRKSWKLDLRPDEFSLDPVVSPRNSNWFLLAVAGRRAITFLEQQPEVDASRIGFTGFSMGGMITALTAIDSRLKAVAPFVGGTGFKYVDFPGGIEGSSIRRSFPGEELKLYASTMDASSYWPLVKCPVMFISSSNDFHSTFERLYQSMELLPHDNWRVTTNIHQNHGPGPEQWVMLNQWFRQYLNGVDQAIPTTPPSTFAVAGDRATFTVVPTDQHRLAGTEIYYSYDPNSRTRFWNHAEVDAVNGSWTVALPVYSDLPLYVFAMCRYRLDRPIALERGETSTFVLNSMEHSFVPDRVDLDALSRLPGGQTVIEDFSNGIQDWSTRDGRTIRTYKFQSPHLDRSNDRKLSLTIDPQGRNLALRLNIDSKFLSQPDNLGDFTYATRIQGSGPQELIISREDFGSDHDKTLEWSKVATFEVTIIDEATRQKLDLTSKEGHAVLQRIQMVD
ncbi:MAG: dienelactone hydrolase family protein [Planctomycetaceae bacterium]|nr:dienelactone hydrolase family protein [Planctomycetaceae bacterium]MCB9926221.1 dienelactone hydrolase family protein [Planctomycetaceae bacterium]